MQKNSRLAMIVKSDPGQLCRNQKQLNMDREQVGIGQTGNNDAQHLDLTKLTMLLLLLLENK